jgi:hypothetical protein
MPMPGRLRRAGRVCYRQPGGGERVAPACACASASQAGVTSCRAGASGRRISCDGAAAPAGPRRTRVPTGQCTFSTLGPGLDRLAGIRRPGRVCDLPVSLRLWRTQARSESQSKPVAVTQTVSR